jgi:penicillin-binding protein-related factor A (putative recombinase)
LSKKNPGKLFEEDFANSCVKQEIFHHRIKDQYIPHKIRMFLAKHKMFLPTSKNKYDNFVYCKPNLFPIELKSTQSKSLSFDKIEDHQIENLHKENNPDKGIISGVVINFREYDNATYFVGIDEFVTYKNVAEGKDTETKFKHKVNKNSIPLDICKEIGLEIKNSIKVSRYTYDMKGFIDRVASK